MLEKSLNEHIGQIDASAIIQDWRDQIDFIVTGDDYDSALQIYPNKGLLAKAGQAIGLSKYGDFVLRRLGSLEGATLVEMLQKLVPAITS